MTARHVNVSSSTQAHIALLIFIVKELERNTLKSLNFKIQNQS